MEKGTSASLALVLLAQTMPKA